MKVASELSENLMRLDAAFQELASQRKALDYTFADIDLYQILKVLAYMAVMLGAERDAEKRTARKRGPNFGELLAAAKRRIFTAVPACPTALTHADNLFIAHSARRGHDTYKMDRHDNWTSTNNL